MRVAVPRCTDDSPRVRQSGVWVREVDPEGKADFYITGLRK